MLKWLPSAGIYTLRTHSLFQAGHEVNTALFSALVADAQAGQQLDADHHYELLMPYSESLRARLKKAWVPYQRVGEHLKVTVRLDRPILVRSSKKPAELRYYTLEAQPMYCRADLNISVTSTERYINSDSKKSLKSSHHVIKREPIMIELCEKRLAEALREYQCNLVYQRSHDDGRRCHLDFHVNPDSLTIDSVITLPKEPGNTLRELLANNQLSEKEVLWIAIRLCEEVALLHTQGWAHRDLKPSNIIYDRKTGRLRLIDFGLSAPLNSEVVLQGTPLFIDRNIARYQSNKLFTAQATHDLPGLEMVLIMLFSPSSHVTQLQSMTRFGKFTYDMSQSRSFVLSEQNLKHCKTENLLDAIFGLGHQDNASRSSIQDVRAQLVEAYRRYDKQLSDKTIIAAKNAKITLTAIEQADVSAENWLLNIIRQKLITFKLKLLHIPKQHTEQLNHLFTLNINNLDGFELIRCFNNIFAQIRELGKSSNNKLASLCQQQLALFETINRYKTKIFPTFMIDLYDLGTKDSASNQMYQIMRQTMHAGQYVSKDQPIALYISNTSLINQLRCISPQPPMIRELSHSLYVVYVTTSEPVVARTSRTPGHKSLELVRKHHVDAGKSAGLSMSQKIQRLGTTRISKAVKTQRVKLDKKGLASEIEAFFNDYYAYLVHQASSKSGRRCHLGVSLDLEHQELVLSLHIPYRSGTDLRKVLKQKVVISDQSNYESVSQRISQQNIKDAKHSAEHPMEALIKLLYSNYLIALKNEICRHCWGLNNPMQTLYERIPNPPPDDIEALQAIVRDVMTEFDKFDFQIINMTNQATREIATRFRELFNAIRQLNDLRANPHLQSNNLPQS